MGVKEAFRSLFARPQPIPTSAVKYGVHLSEEEKKVLKTLGVYVNNLSSLISWANTINQDRISVSRDIERSLQHPMISQALKLYTSFATNFDRVNNATVWVTSPNAKYRNLGEEFLDNLNVEGRVTDWVYNLAGFGNHFLGVKGLPGHGVISVDDSENQINLCIRGDTKICLLDGTSPTIAEMVVNKEKYVGKKLLSINPETKELEVDEIENVMKTRLNAELVRVWLDNGKYIDCTPDHRFMLRDGSYKEAQNLQPNESLMPYYTKDTCLFSSKYGTTKGYQVVYNPGKNSWEFTYRLVCGRNRKNISSFKGKVIHHKDTNKSNNEPENLEIKTASSHARIRRVKYDKKICPNCGKEFECISTLPKKYCNEKCFQEYTKAIRVTKICPICGKEFQHSIKSPQICCSLECANRRDKSGKIIRCLECGKEFYIDKCMIGISKFCSGECAKKYHKEKEMVLTKCACCGREFHLSLSEVNKVKYCSKECSFKAYNLERKCLYCGKTFYIVKNLGKNYFKLKLFYCSKECFIKSQDGKNYVGGPFKWVKEKESVLNHKVMKVERLLGKEDTYDLTVRKNHNFPTAAGVFIHNSRVDSEGVLLGFYHTPLGNVSNVQKLLPPWSYVHMSMNGTKVRRPIYGESQSTEFRSISLLSPDIRRLSSQYGTGVVNDAIPTYKRMRLTEDSIMLAALSKRILRYLIKVGVDGNNIEGIKEVLDQYASVLKRQKAINPNSNQMTDNLDYTDVVTDILLPVWGGVNNLELEKMGGDIDVKWIADLDDQRAMLATSLDVPLNMFGGFTQETPSGLNTSAAESISVTFARKSRMVQRGTIEGFRRLFQIHLAYLGMNPDLKLFDVCMSDTSTVEEAERVKVLKDTIDSLQSFTDFITNLLGERIDRVWLLDYLNQKFLKLNDFQINKLIKNQDPNNFVTVMKEKINKEQIKQLLVETKVNEEEKEKVLRFVDENYSNSYRKPKVCSMDVRAHLPLKESKAQWESLYGKTKVKEEIIKEEKK